MPEKVTTKLSFFETDMEFAAPFLNILLDRAKLVEQLYDAFRQWGVTVDDVEFVTTGKPSEQGVRFKLPKKQSAFFAGPAFCKFTRDNTDWSVAPETIEMIDTAVSVIESQTPMRISKRKTVIALHLQPEKLPFMELLAPFVTKGLAALEDRPIQAMAAIINWNDRKVTIDTSAHVVNGIFLRLERDFDASVDYGTIAERLQEDERQVYDLLGIEDI